MHILENQVIKDHYDAIIIGSGLGGVTAAALLAQKGFDVLMAEHHYMPGGCCSAVRRGGTTSDVGASILFGFAERGLTQHRFVHNYLQEPIDVIRHDSIYRCHWKDEKGKNKEVTIWRDFEKFMGSLSEAFPGREGELRRLYDSLGEMYDAVMGYEMPMAFTEMPMSIGMKLFQANPLGMLKLMPYMTMTGGELMGKYIKDPELIGFYNMLILTFTLVPSEINPGLMTGMVFADCNRGGAFYPVGSPQMLPNKMEKAFEKFDGTALYRNKVERILFDTSEKKPRACGVRLEKGTEITADYVVSNSNIYNFYGGLVPPALCPPGKIQKTMSLEPSQGVFPIYLSVDAEAIPEDARNVEVFISNITDLENGTIRFVFTPSLDDPTLAPEGVHSMTIVQNVEPGKWPRPNDPYYQSEEYYAEKDRLAWEAIKEVEDFFPGLSKHIRTMEPATPTTMERFTLKYKGNIGGPVGKVGQHMHKREHARTKGFKNLYMCGDSTTMGTGVVSSCSSGISVANVILQDAGRGKEQYLPRDFDKQYVNIVGAHSEPLMPLPDFKAPLESEEEGRRWARECDWCVDHRCRTCPADIDIPAFMRRIEVENYAGAARSMREMNPLSEICGIVCPAEKLCESDCYRLDYEDKPVRIKDLQAFACRTAGKKGFNRSTATMNGRKVAVIGAGPGGLSCAHFLARLGYVAHVYEKNQDKGGMLTHGILASRLPEEVVERELEGICLPTIIFKYGQALGKDVTLKKLSKEYEAVFMAPGLWQGRLLDIEGSEKVEATDALSFIRSSRETSKVKTKDRVLVIGGGSVAADAAHVAKSSGAKQVTMVCIESAEEMPALESEVDELKGMGVEIINGWGPKAFRSGTCLEGVSCKSVFDSKGNFDPKFDNTKSRDFEFDQVVMAVGQDVESDLAQYLDKEFGSSRIKVDPETQQIQGRKNVYAGGDIVRGAGTIVEAVADGRRAAKAIHAGVSAR